MNDLCHYYFYFLFVLYKCGHISNFLLVKAVEGKNIITDYEKYAFASKETEEFEYVISKLCENLMIRLSQKKLL